MGEIKIDAKKCVGDNICVEKCPMDVLEATSEGKKKAFCTPKRMIPQLDSNMLTVELARNPVDSHWASLWSMPKEPMMSGSATLMIVVIKRATNVPLPTAAMANQR